MTDTPTTEADEPIDDGEGDEGDDGVDDPAPT
jgi:hypothetical protein